MQALEDRPPYVSFERRAVEDREATIANGFYTTKDVDFAIITPAGSRDRVEREASLWFESIKQQTAEGRFKREWLDAYRSVYKEWQVGNEIPETGFSVRNWRVLAPSQIDMLIGLNLRTVEDLAAASDDVLDRIGMGARALRQQAVDFLGNQDKNATSVLLTALKAENEGLKVDNAKLAAALAEAQKVIEGLTKKV
jgi:hypothetical protein